MGTVSHEFFHAWNVERIRPATLEPFNFEDANISGELWLAEGFTNYYEPLILTRAGLMRFVLKLMANLTDPRDGDFNDRVINALSRMAPAA